MAHNDKTLKENEGFPSEFATPEEKKEEKYGLQMAKAIHRGWKKDSNYSEQIERFKECRRYAEGLQSVDKYKDLLDSEGDISALNLDWSIVPVLSKFVDIMVGEMINMDYKLKLEAIDVNSTSEKDKERNRLKADIFLKPYLDKLESVSNIKTQFPKDGDPKTPEEVELHMQLNFRLATEIDMEKALDFVYFNSDWEEIKKRVYRDFVCLKRGILKVYFDENQNIRLRYVDPVNYITTYTDQPDFKNCQYGGELRSLSIGEIRRINPDLKEEQLFEIAKLNASKHGNREWGYGNEFSGYYHTQHPSYGSTQAPYDDFMIRCLEFSFLSTDRYKYEKKSNKYNSFFINEKRSSYEIPEDKQEGRELLHDEWENCYSGLWVLGTEYMIQYGLDCNIIREKENGDFSKNTSLPYILYAPNIYDMENKSVVERMMPHQDQLQFVHLKQQQMLARIAPPGMSVDVSTLRDINLGLGKKSSSPMDLLELYRQTGVFFYEGRDEDDVPMNRAPISEVPNSIGNTLQELSHIYQQQLQMMRDVSGLNETRDASSENQRALVGVEQMRLKLSRNTSMPLIDAFLSVYRRSAERSTLMIQELIDLYGEGTALTNVLGEMGIKNIQLGAEHQLCQYGIKIEPLMDDEERRQLDEDIAVCLANQTLEIEDSIYIRNIDNYKLANQYLIVRKKLKRKQDMQEAQANSEMNAQIQERSAAAKAQADMQVKQQEAQLQAMLLQEENKGKADLEILKHQHKMEELALQGEFKSRHIQEASDEDFKNTALSNSVSQPKVFAGSSLSKTDEKTTSQ